MSTSIKVAIVGFGAAGKFFHTGLLNGLQELFTIDTVVSTSQKKVLEILPYTKVIQDLSLLKNSQTELVVIATPSHTHYELAMRAIKLGKHVVIDKPIASTLEEAEELIYTANKHGVILTVFQNRRWDNGFLTAISLREKQLLGQIYQFNASFDRFRPVVDHTRWREKNFSASGTLFDLGIHLVDQAIYLLGKPLSWSVTTAKQREGSLQTDAFTISLQYQTALATLSSSSLSSLPRPVIEVFGDKASYTKHTQDPQESQLKSGTTPSDNNWGIEDSSRYGVLSFINNGIVTSEPISSEKGSYEQFYTLLHQCITQGKEPPVAACSTILPLKIITSEYAIV
jgi:scyllo-inositol 2-dehydrogenase (NADP+)